MRWWIINGKKCAVSHSTWLISSMFPFESLLALLPWPSSSLLSPFLCWAFTNPWDSNQNCYTLGPNPRQSEISYHTFIRLRHVPVNISVDIGYYRIVGLTPTYIPPTMSHYHQNNMAYCNVGCIPIMLLVILIPWYSKDTFQYPNWVCLKMWLILYWFIIIFPVKIAMNRRCTTFSDTHLIYHT